jgi:hypothetical protein
MERWFIRKDVINAREFRKLSYLGVPPPLDDIKLAPTANIPENR